MPAFRTKAAFALAVCLLLSFGAQAQDVAPKDARTAGSVPAASTVGAVVPGKTGKTATAETKTDTKTAGKQTADKPPAALTPPAGRPVAIAKPVESSALHNINPNSVGLLGDAQGGLGAGMWKGSSAALVERLLPGLDLPTASPALNNLARRFLLTAADVPKGATGKPGLTSLRVEKLVALGDAGDAWKLARMATPGLIEDGVMRHAADAALLSGEARNVCAQLPPLIQNHNSPAWQEPLIVCQLRAGDAKAAQLGLDVLHAQDLHDDLFYTLAERNVIGGNKFPPGQLTPIEPLNLALLLLMKQPLPGEVYARPGAALIPALLQAKARVDDMRLALAERAAARGLITAAQLEDAYRAAVFTPDQLKAPLTAPENGARLRALLYQAALAEKDPQQRLAEAVKFLDSADSALLSGAGGQVPAAMAGTIAPDAADAVFAAPLAEMYLFAGQPQAALPWMVAAQKATAPTPENAALMQKIWPLAVLSGVVSDSDYAQGFDPWLAAMLKDAGREQRGKIGKVLLLLDAAGFAVPDDAWAQVIDAGHAERRGILPDPLLLTRLRAAGAAGKRGEAVLLSLALAGKGREKTRRRKRLTNVL